MITGFPSPLAIDPGLVEEFHLRGARQPSCLLIHGFSGTPYETRALGEALQARGHAALGVRLAGHGRTVEELERSTWQDWYRDVAAGCSERTVTRLFGKATGMTPLRYQQALRVERADHLIGQGATVETAARNVGFEDARMLRRLRSR